MKRILEEYYKTLKEIDDKVQAEVPHHWHGYWSRRAGRSGAEQEPYMGSGTRLYRGTGIGGWEMEGHLERYFREWITKHSVKLANTFTAGWEPTGAPRNGFDFCEMSEADLKKWKIIGHIAVSVNWETRSTVARNCLAQHISDHRLVVTCICFWKKEETWHHSDNDNDNDNDTLIEVPHTSMRAWPYRQERRGHGPTKKSLSYR